MSNWHARTTVLVATLLLPLTSLAHDEHEWINRGKYKNQRGEHCCGVNDCLTVPESDVYDAGDYFIYIPTQERISRKEAHKSEDGNYHRCHYYSQGIRMTRCFFYPVRNS